MGGKKGYPYASECTERGRLMSVEHPYRETAAIYWASADLGYKHTLYEIYVLRRYNHHPRRETKWRTAQVHTQDMDRS